MGRSNLYGVNYRGLLSVGSVGRCVRPGRGVGSVPALWLRWYLFGGGSVCFRQRVKALCGSLIGVCGRLCNYGFVAVGGSAWLSALL